MNHLKNYRNIISNKSERLLNKLFSFTFDEMVSDWNENERWIGFYLVWEAMEYLSAFLVPKMAYYVTVRQSVTKFSIASLLKNMLISDFCCSKMVWIRIAFLLVGFIFFLALLQFFFLIYQLHIWVNNINHESCSIGFEQKKLKKWFWFW